LGESACCGFGLFSSDGITSVLQPALVAPVEELLYRSRVSHASCGYGYWR
jgi:hypothetical protein